MTCGLNLKLPHCWTRNDCGFTDFCSFAARTRQQSPSRTVQHLWGKERGSGVKVYCSRSLKVKLIKSSPHCCQPQACVQQACRHRRTVVDVAACNGGNTCSSGPSGGCGGRTARVCSASPCECTIVRGTSFRTQSPEFRAAAQQTTALALLQGRPLLKLRTKHLERLPSTLLRNHFIGQMRGRSHFPFNEPLS